MQWFRMYSEFAHDPKIQSMSESYQRRLIMLFCLRSCDVLGTLHSDDIAFHLRITSEEMEETKKVFLAKGFIDKYWNILNWEKRQYVSDSSTYRTRKYRERAKNVTGTSQERHGDALDTDTDTETDKKRNKEKNVCVENQPQKIKTEKPKNVIKPDDVDEQIWNDYAQVRKAKKVAPITKTALAGIISQANLAGYTLNDALKICCERNWVGFKSEWVEKKKVEVTKKTNSAFDDQKAMDALIRQVQEAEKW